MYILIVGVLHGKWERLRKTATQISNDILHSDGHSKPVLHRHDIQPYRYAMLLGVVG
jgi:hypothetical protein